MRCLFLLVVLGALPRLGLARNAMPTSPFIVNAADTSAREISADSARSVARTWLARTEDGARVFLDSTRTFDADSEWQVSFKRRIDITPKIVLVGVNKTSRRVRFIPTR